MHSQVKVENQNKYRQGQTANPAKQSSASLIKTNLRPTSGNREAIVYHAADQKQNRAKSFNFVVTFCSLLEKRFKLLSKCFR